MLPEIDKLGRDAFIYLRNECSLRDLPFDRVLEEQIKGLASVAATCSDTDSKRRMLAELTHILGLEHQSSR